MSVMKARLFAVFVSVVAASAIFFFCQMGANSGGVAQETPAAHLGFDLNIYPGNAALAVLRKTFVFGGYWLSPPPGEKSNSWAGKREAVRAQGFGFLLLYRGREIREIKNKKTAAEKGVRDARAAALAAKKDGFPEKAAIFLDIEEGGRLPEAYHEYLRAWAKELAAAGYHAGAYCSGMPVQEEPGVAITTADDIRAHAPSQDFAFFVYNDACPPSPGCVFPQAPLPPSESGIPYAAIWQFAQSPRRMEFTAHCAPGYHADGNCYAPGDKGHAWFLDIDSATSADPSHGR